MSVEPTAQGSRRIDRVLAEDYLAGLAEAPLGDVRSLRDEAEQEEADLSYLRRLLQGRIDILRAERTARLKGKGVTDVDVERLTDILSSRSTPQTEEDV